MVTNRVLICLVLCLSLAFGATSIAQESAVADAEAAQREKFRSLDEDVQDLKKEVLDLNSCLLYTSDAADECVNV